MDPFENMMKITGLLTPQNAHTHKVSGLKGSETHSHSSTKAAGKPLTILSRNVLFRYRIEFWLFHFQLCVVAAALKPTSGCSGN